MENFSKLEIQIRKYLSEFDQNRQKCQDAFVMAMEALKNATATADEWIAKCGLSEGEKSELEKVVDWFRPLIF